MGGEVKFRLTLDASGFQDGLAKALWQTREITTSIKDVFEGLSEVLVAPFVEFADQIGDMSEKTGLSTKTLQEYGAAAKLSGTNIEALSSTFNKFQKNLVAGNKETVDAMGTLGLKISDLGKMSSDGQLDA